MNDARTIRVWLSAAFFLIILGYGVARSIHASAEAASYPGASQATKSNAAYRVLAPIESGNLLLFPVVRSSGELPAKQSFLTLDEGIKSGDVEVTEAGKAQGLVRPRGGSDVRQLRGDQVNTLVLINHSARPLLLLAGEIVTGGKQDRVIAKDRIVPAGSDPIDLSVFCIEHGRWTESSAKFGVTGRVSAGSFMVQPAVRQRAMVSKDQQQVWNAVGSAISTMGVAAAPAQGRALPTTSYAKVMQQEAVSDKVDEAASAIMKSRDQVIAALRREHAVGVVVSVRGEIVWADIFADTDLLSRYWNKLVRSYAAESLSTTGLVDAAAQKPPTPADAQRFLEQPSGATESSNGEVDTYRYTEIKSEATDTFVLESLIAPAAYEVHISKLRITDPDRYDRVGVIIR